eukprot:PhF_6_TR9170/c0_g1_i3/m.14271/K16765/CEP78; centrosomal protein CEP78
MSRLQNPPPRKSQQQQQQQPLSGFTFDRLYLRSCVDLKVEPFHPFLASLVYESIDADVDYLTTESWRPFIMAFRTATQSYKNIVFRVNQTNDVVSLPARSELKHPVRKVRRDRPVTPPEPNIASKLCAATAHAMYYSPHLHRLCFEGIHLTKHHVAPIATALPQCLALTHVSFRDSQLGDDAITDIVHSLRSLDLLFSVDFSGCDLTDKSGAAVVGLLRHQQVRRDGIVWQRQLRTNIPSHQNNNITVPSLQHIDLSRNFYGVVFVKMLCKVLHDDVHVTHVHLRRNCLNHDAIRFVSNLLNHNSTLLFLDLSENEGVKNFVPVKYPNGVLETIGGPNTLCYIRQSMVLGGPASALPLPNANATHHPRLTPYDYQHGGEEVRRGVPPENHHHSNNTSTHLNNSYESDDRGRPHRLDAVHEGAGDAASSNSGDEFEEEEKRAKQNRLLHLMESAHRDNEALRRVVENLVSSFATINQQQQQQPRHPSPPPPAASSRDRSPPKVTTHVTYQPQPEPQQQQQQQQQFRSDAINDERIMSLQDQLRHQAKIISDLTIMMELQQQRQQRALAPQQPPPLHQQTEVVTTAHNQQQQQQQHDDCAECSRLDDIDSELSRLHLEASMLAENAQNNVPSSDPMLTSQIKMRLKKYGWV